ncbi:CobW family GTP-binding protein [Clostridium sp. Marseille-P2415]|uniref:CobW family GTP-binding protein n=1 Tax=Clostridium sp. Marseille-P2415 TaxID=1805471 RepID=UPI00098831DC|nr:CobW family GTP-binding protein [Clostridium sp. Marseille-P2415]
MPVEIYVISGFLGAGKTTLIKKMINEIFKNKRIALIENDFGERSVDAALLKSEAIEIKEINSGCICCSLSGDFKKSLKGLMERFHPDKILIEPSGVGKLSDVVKACSDPSIRPYAEVKAKITVVDVKRCKMYLDNFGEFFEDQIRNADLIFLSRTSIFPDRIIEAQKIVKSLNSDSAIISNPWEQVDLNEILNTKSEKRVNTGRQKIMAGQRHCSHSRFAEETFETVTIRTRRIFSKEELKACVLNMERTAKGTVLRAKGIVQGTGGCMSLQYLPGEIQITSCTSDGDMLCIIGQNLNRNELYAIFNGI